LGILILYSIDNDMGHNAKAQATGKGSAPCLNLAHVFSLGPIRHGFESENDIEMTADQG
jgi:hypothetical protein